MADTALVGSIKDLTADTSKLPARKVGQELGKDAFLQLLVSQLKNQDPMKPMEDSQFIGQMAQFSSLEQMQNLNKTMESQTQFQDLTQASGMIGKYASIVANGDTGQIVTGKVDEVRQAGGKVTVVVGGKEYASSMINRVSANPIDGAAPATPTPAATTPTPTT